MENYDYDISIYCLAYNHEKYIEKTIQSFVEQKTTYSMQIIIHDDASIDETRNIIKKYQQLYPNLITPILQSDNQYSKDVDIFRTFIQPRIQGKYVACCEGDDYWCDTNKIQSQIDFLEQNPKYSACVHNTGRIQENGSSCGSLINKSNVDYDIDTNEVIRKGAELFHVNSMIYRMNDRLKMPKSFTIPGVGDYPLMVYMSMLGPIHYMSKVMSVYRINSSGSWSQRMKSDREKRIIHSNNVINALRNMDDYSEQQYHQSFQVVLNYTELRKYYYQRAFSKIVFHPPYWKIIIGRLKRKKVNNGRQEQSNQ